MMVQIYSNDFGQIFNLVGEYLANSPFSTSEAEKVIIQEAIKSSQIPNAQGSHPHGNGVEPRGIQS